MAEVDYTARFILPFRYERARINLFQCPVYRSGALVAPSSGTVTIYDRSNTAIISAAAVTVTASIAEYSSAAQTTHAYEDGWAWEWSLVMPDGVTHVFRNSGALVRNRLAQAATDDDLFRRVSSLDPDGNAPITTDTDFQTYLDEAWVDIVKRIEQDVRHPWRIINATELREPHVLLTLALIFEDLATRLNPAHIETARMYREQFSGSFGRVALIYDESDTGTGDPSKKRGARAGGFWLGSAGRRTRWGD